MQPVSHHLVKDSSDKQLSGLMLAGPPGELELRWLMGDCPSAQGEQGRESPSSALKLGLRRTQASCVMRRTSCEAWDDDLVSEPRPPLSR